MADESDKPEGEEAPKRRRRRRRGAGGDEGEAAPASSSTAPETGDDASQAAAKPPARTGGRRSGAAGYSANGRPATVQARARYVRSSARKARLVSEHLHGRSVEEARAVLAHTTRGVARDWSKLLESAVANAEHNHELVGDELRVREAYADEGPTLKRYRPRAMGRATRIRKRTTHLTITLTPKEGS